MKPRLFLIATTSLVFLLFFAGCSALPVAEPVEGSERDQVLEEYGPIAESIFQAINNSDYAAFSENFDATMKKALPENSFRDMAGQFDEKIGKYQKARIDKVEVIENLYVLTYILTYEKEEQVSARVSFRQGELPQVSGLWFDSPKLREK